MLQRSVLEGTLQCIFCVFCDLHDQGLNPPTRKTVSPTTEAIVRSATLHCTVPTYASDSVK
eukprot:1072671-Pyramimonas_sp.AAC.2